MLVAWFESYHCLTFKKEKKKKDAVYRVESTDEMCLFINKEICSQCWDWFWRRYECENLCMKASEETIKQGWEKWQSPAKPCSLFWVHKGCAVWRSLHRWFVSRRVVFGTREEKNEVIEHCICCFFSYFPDRKVWWTRTQRQYALFLHKIYGNWSKQEVVAKSTHSDH